MKPAEFKARGKGPALSNRATDHRTQVILDWLMNNLDDYETAECYGEPGYKDPEEIILFANWNHVPQWIQNYLEATGFELEWSDEWYIDYDHAGGKAYRTSPNSYFWQSVIHFTESGNVLTPDDSDEDWIEEFLNSPRKALPERFHDKMIELGFWRYPSDGEPMFEHGWHPGQTDDPNKIAKEIETRFINMDYVFVIPEVSQFYIKFEVWCRFCEDGNYQARNVGGELWTEVTSSGHTMPMWMTLDRLMEEVEVRDLKPEEVEVIYRDVAYPYTRLMEERNAKSA